MTEKASKMIFVLKENIHTFLKNDKKSENCFAPNIPTKVTERLIKNFDNHLAANSLIAVFDTSPTKNNISGFVFTTDGFYCKSLGKAIYIQYADILSSCIKDKTLEIKLDNEGFPEFTIKGIHSAASMRRIIEKMKEINREYGYSSNKITGRVQKIELPPEMMKSCQKIIHSATVLCGATGTGLAQIPLADNLVITPIQISMVIGLGAVFELNITESTAKSMLLSAAASYGGRAITQVLWGWMPGAGNAINATTAAAITELVGWMVAGDFYERWIQDKTKGRLEGMKDGYVEASAEYGRKLRQQAQAFQTQIKDFQKEHAAYEKLLNEYEIYIQQLEKERAAAEMIAEYRDIYNELKAMRTA